MSYSVLSSDWFLVLIPSRGGAVSGGGLDSCSLTQHTESDAARRGILFVTHTPTQRKLYGTLQ